IFAFHPLLGVTASLGAIVLIGMTGLTEFLTKEPISLATKIGTSRARMADASRRNAEVITAMGMSPYLQAKWSQINVAYIDKHRAANDVTTGLGSISKILRLVLQSAMLAVGAYLVINQRATAGIIIAGSILAGRALAPVDLAIAHWKSFVTARQSWRRLARLLEAVPAPIRPMALPDPRSNLTLEAVNIVAPGTRKL